MAGLLTAARRCQRRLWGSITLSKSNYNIICKAPLCSPFFAATTLYTKPTPWTTPIMTPAMEIVFTPWTTPIITPCPQVTDPAMEIVFFDLEATFPCPRTGKRHLLEFGAVVLCAHTLAEKSRHTFPIRPSPEIDIPKKMTDVKFSTAPFFVDVAPEIFNLLNGRIWAGHNMDEYDAPLIREAFHSIGQIPPREAGIIDTYLLLKDRLPLQDYKLATFAKYFKFGEQKHRSLEDVLLNIDVLKHTATLDFLRSKTSVLAPRQGELVSGQLSKTLRNGRSRYDTRRQKSRSGESKEN